ncbi:hypothetical protein T484DRAFT_2607565 [Baffinella frigidus]|nr:hypothetical protein T484DRAFT_2607565 [Cryptophyta sp. CCMP2293]
MAGLPLPDWEWWRPSRSGKREKRWGDDGGSNGAAVRRANNDGGMWSAQYLGLSEMRSADQCATCYQEGLPRQNSPGWFKLGGRAHSRRRTGTECSRRWTRGFARLAAVSLFTALVCCGLGRAACQDLSRRSTSQQLAARTDPLLREGANAASDVEGLDEVLEALIGGARREGETAEPKKRCLEAVVARPILGECVDVYQKAQLLRTCVSSEQDAAQRAGVPHALLSISDLSAYANVDSAYVNQQCRLRWIDWAVPPPFIYTCYGGSKEMEPCLGTDDYYTCTLGTCVRLSDRPDWPVDWWQRVDPSQFGGNMPTLYGTRQWYCADTPKFPLGLVDTGSGVPLNPKP